MNLFLLAAVPLAAVILQRLFYPLRPVFAEPTSWFTGFVWSAASLVAVTPFGKLREFGGDLGASALGLALTDALLVPGIVLLVWMLTRSRRDVWELGLWLAIVFTMAGLRDFAATSRVYDLNEFFLIPLDRIALLLLLPGFATLALRGNTLQRRAIGGVSTGLLILTGPFFQILSFAGWGWLVWLLEVLAILGGLWVQKKTAPGRSGSATGSLV